MIIKNNQKQKIQIFKQYEEKCIILQFLIFAIYFIIYYY